MIQAVFLDRDGVINKVILKKGKPFSPRKTEELELCDGIKEFLSASKSEGFLNIAVTNQPDIARGLMEWEGLTAINKLITENLSIDDVLVCPHDDYDNCPCRKPKAGLLLEAAKKWNIDLANSFLIGDQWKDIEAGRNAGCVTILLAYPYNEDVCADFRVTDLQSASEIIRRKKMGGVRTIMADYIIRYLKQVKDIAERIEPSKIEQMVNSIAELRSRGGRLFFIGVGGGAGNSTHAVNDFRKIAGIEAYTPTDNVSELTARINDNGWRTMFVDWLRGSRLTANDGVFVFSVGGGNEEKGISTNIVDALKYAKQAKAKIFGIVGRDGGYTAKTADVCITIPIVSDDTVTAHTESFQAVLWHLIVSHPKMKTYEMKWESVK